MSVPREVELTVRQPPPGPISYAQFLEWLDEDTFAEWVDGRVDFIPLPVTREHAAAQALVVCLAQLAARLGERASVYGLPFQMYLPSLRRSRTPDVFLVRAERRHLVRDYYLEGPADIVVEVISPESVHRDRVEKLAEYEAAGVPEYWLVESEAPGLEVRVLGPDGRYRVAFTGAAGLYQSAVLPQLRLRAEWLWQEPGPDLDEVLRELGAGAT